MDQNPVHTYLVPGSYNVSLSVTNGNGSDAITQTGYITIVDSNSCDTSSLNAFNSPLVLTNCGGVVVDNGGANGNYSPFGQGLVSIQPAGAGVVILDFAQFDIRNQDDFIVFDGPDDLSPIIGTYNGTTLPNGGQIISSGNSISFELDVAGGGGGGGFGAGFIVNWNCSFVSVEEYQDQGFALFPNPAHNTVRIGLDNELTGDSQITLLNTLGQVVLRRTITLSKGSNDLDISAIPAGTYAVEIINETRILTSQLVVQ